MKKRYRVLLTILGSILIFLAGGWAQEKFNLGADLFNQPHLEEGLKRYAPTRMQWLALEMDRYKPSPQEKAYEILGYKVSYLDTGGRINVRLTYKHDLEYEKVKSAITHVKVRVLMHAAKYGWDSWVKVRLELHKSPDPNLDKESAFKEFQKNPIEIYEWKGNEKPILIKSD
ncbi:MAG: hypothetical protein OXU23_15760 [Candidatus Poribacteria bacterium]|nr:hypothetical protein [Candidatus Poribacteria bacterium]